MFYSYADAVASQQQAQLTNSSPSDDSAVPNGMLNNPELAIDEGTISLSSQYSQGYVLTMVPNKTFLYFCKFPFSQSRFFL
jgi:hypothetical protein